MAEPANEGFAAQIVKPVLWRVREEYPGGVDFIKHRTRRDARADAICYDLHLGTITEQPAFTSDTDAYRRLALMNLEIHGCVGIAAANLLCDAGLVSPVIFAKPRENTFEAVEIEFAGTIEIGRVSMAEAANHPFITEAFARMRVDQFAADRHVVFDHGYLSRCNTRMLDIAFARSARGWRRQSAINDQG